MSSSNTSWTTESNTKSGSVKVYSSDVSVLKVVGGEGGDAIIDLFADQGDDNADKWRLWVNASDDDLHFSNYTSGTAWTDILTLQDGGNVGIGTASPQENLHIYKSSANVKVEIESVAAGANAVLKFQSPSSYWEMINDGTSGNLDFQRAGSSKVFFKSDGNIGIGANNPEGKLHIYSGDSSVTPEAGADDLFIENNGNAGITIGSATGSAGNIYFGDSGDANAGRITYDHAGPDNLYFYTAGTSRMLIDNSGKVGIGATSPGGRLAIEETSANGTGIFVDHNPTITTGNTYAIDVDVNKTGVTADSAQATVHGILIDVDDTPLDGGGSSTVNHAGSTTVLTGLKVDVTGVGSGSTTNYGVYSVVASADANYPGVFMGGNVGIGDTTPDQELHVAGSNTTATALWTNCGPGNIPGIRIQNSDATNDNYAGYFFENDSMVAGGIVMQFTNHSSDASSMYFATAYEGNTRNKMMITPTGKVGIGTDAPTELLHLKSSTSAKPTLLIENTHADINAGTLDFMKNTGDNSEADDDLLGIIRFKGDDSANVMNTYASIAGYSQHVANEDESGGLTIEILHDGTAKNMFEINSYGQGVVGDGTIVFNEQGNDMDFRVEAVGAANALFVKGSDGKVGIGTDDPAEFLDVAANIRMGNKSTTDNGIASYFTMERDGNIVGGLSTYAGVFNLFAGTTTSAQHLTIRADGDVGIGTGNPGALLHIERDLNAADDLGDWDNYHLVLRSPTGSTNDTVAMLFSTSDDTYGGSAIVSYDTGSGGKSDLAFFTKRNTAAEPPTEAMRIDDAGNVGIGSDDPKMPLHVKANSNNEVFLLEEASGGETVGFATNVGDLWVVQGTTSDVDAEGTVLMIKDGGNVGIGEDDPDTPLHVKSSANQVARFESTDAYGGIELADNNSGTLPPLISALSNDLIIYGGHDSSRPEIIRIKTGGKVGIKTDDPLQELDLVGQFISADNKTDDTNKQAIFLSHQYDSGTETEGFMMMETFASSSANRIDIGGGHSSYNAATEITFNTAANTSTRTGTERMSIQSDGKISMGAASVTADILTLNKLAGDSQLDMNLYSDNASNEFQLQFGRSNQDTVGFTATADNTLLGSIQWRGSNNSTWTYPARIKVVQDGATGAADSYTGAEMLFQTSDGTATQATRMIIDKNGNVGIGEPSPGVELDVAGRVAIGNGTELTIASGAITITQSYHTVDTESDAGSDDLVTINGGSAGAILVLRAKDSSRTVVCKDATGNLQLSGDFSMDTDNDTITLIFDGSSWFEMSRSNNG